MNAPRCGPCARVFVFSVFSSLHREPFLTNRCYCRCPLLFHAVKQKPKFVSRLNCRVENTLRHAIRMNIRSPQTASLDRFAIRRIKLNLSAKIAHDIRWKWVRVGISVCCYWLNVFTVRASTFSCIVFFFFCFGTLVCDLVPFVQRRISVAMRSTHNSVSNGYKNKKKKQEPKNNSFYGRMQRWQTAK